MKKYKYLFAIGMAVGGFALLIIDYFTPPKGELSSFVMLIFSEILQFSAALIGINFKYNKTGKE